MKTFTTDKAIYTIETHEQRRVTEFIGGAPVWSTIISYRIFKDDEFLSVAYDEADIPLVIDCQERPERHNVGSRFD